MSLSTITNTIINPDLMTMSFEALGRLVKDYAIDFYENEGCTVDFAETWILEEVAALDALRPGFADYYEHHFI